MKIARIEQFFPRPRMRLVKVTTDDGIVGWGEATLEGKPKSTMAAVEELADYLIGKDPLPHRAPLAAHLPLGLLPGRQRADERALRARSRPVGHRREILRRAGLPVARRADARAGARLRALGHPRAGGGGAGSGRGAAGVFAGGGGYTAFKSGPAGTWRAHEPPARIDEFVACAYRMRELVGPGVELAFDFHGKMTPALAIEVCHELRGMRPMFVEEPVPQENVEALKLVADHVPFPIATGERLLSRWEFRPLFERGACAYIQPDVAHAGGISELKRIANMAEVYYMHIMPHCAIGPVALTACVHVDAAVPNFLIQELVGPDRLLPDLIQTAWTIADGYITLPTVPDLGIEVDEREAARMTAYTEELGGEWFHPSDGSVADW